MPQPNMPISLRGYPRPMILWTIQTLSAWKMLQSRGRLHTIRSCMEDHFRPAYRWMKGQMRQRLGQPPFAACFPLWAWFQWHGCNKRRPDLRFSGHLPCGETGVLIEFHAEESEVLLSDFELWHYVLNYWYLPHSNEDEARFDAILVSLAANTPSEVPTSNQAFHADVRKSWEQIFDIHWSRPDIASEFTQKQIQATLWRLNRNQVKNRTIFKAH
jgi:hypothetical protein